MSAKDDAQFQEISQIAKDWPLETAMSAPSRAARDLAESMIDTYISDQHADKVAERIQSALADLLENAQSFSDCVFSGLSAQVHDPRLCRRCSLRKLLEPWKVRFSEDAWAGESRQIEKEVSLTGNG